MCDDICELVNFCGQMMGEDVDYRSAMMDYWIGLRTYGFE